MNILFTYELQRRLVNSTITINACHPGVIGTGLWSNNKFMCIPMVLSGCAPKCPCDGSKSSIYAATSNSVISGLGYFVPRLCWVSRTVTVEDSYDSELACKLWKESVKYAKVTKFEDIPESQVKSEDYTPTNFELALSGLNGCFSCF